MQIEGSKEGLNTETLQKWGCCRVSMSRKVPASGGLAVIIFGLLIRFKFPGKRESKVYRQCEERTKMYQLPRADVIYFAFASLKEMPEQHCAQACPSQRKPHSSTPEK